MPASEVYPVWSSASSNITKSRQGSMSDYMEPGSCVGASEGSSSPLPVWDVDDSTMWDFPLPSQFTEAPTPAAAPPGPSSTTTGGAGQPAESDEVPAWESAPAAWHYDDAQKLAVKLLTLDVSTENCPPRDFGERGCATSSVMNPRFKTEFCRNFREKGNCVYGDLCQFAHGKTELRQDVVRHSKYKTKLCQKFWIAGYCAYGARCNFIHQEEEVGEPKPSNPHGSTVGGFRPFRSTFHRKTSESSDSGVDTGLAMQPPRQQKFSSFRPMENVLKPGRNAEKRWNSSSCSIAGISSIGGSGSAAVATGLVYPELNMNLPQESNRNFFTSIQKVNMGLEPEKSVVHHPEHNPIPTFDKSRF